MADNLHPEFSSRLEQLQEVLRNQYGLETAIGSGLRDMREQARLYAQGRTTKGPVVTHAAPGHSYHNYGAAVDLRPLNMDEAKAGKIIGQAFRDNPELGLVWGGTFRNLYDPLHVQLNNPLADLRAGRPIAPQDSRVLFEAAPLGGAMPPQALDVASFARPERSPAPTMPAPAIPQPYGQPQQPPRMPVQMPENLFAGPIGTGGIDFGQLVRMAGRY